MVNSPGQCQEGDRLRLRPDEYPAAFLKRTSRCINVIYEQYLSTGDSLRMTYGKGVMDVCRPGFLSQAHLRRREDFSPERGEIERNIESFRYVSRQDHGLVEPPFPQPISVQRHRDDSLKDPHIPDPAGEISHQPAKDLAYPGLPPVLEPVNGRQQRIFIPSNRSGNRIGLFRDETVAAEVVVPIRNGKRDPTPVTEGGADEMDPFKTGWAEGEGIMSLQEIAAGGAAGRENEVGDPGQDLFQDYIPLASDFRETVSSGTAIRGAPDQSRSRS